jgi:hypothetical protein
MANTVLRTGAKSASIDRVGGIAAWRFDLHDISSEIAEDACEIRY